jgi:hypothetical protein
MTPSGCCGKRRRTQLPLEKFSPFGVEAFQAAAPIVH